MMKCHHVLIILLAASYEASAALTSLTLNAGGAAQMVRTHSHQVPKGANLEPSSLLSADQHVDFEDAGERVGFLEGAKRHLNVFPLLWSYAVPVLIVATVLSLIALRCCVQGCEATRKANYVILFPQCVMVIGFTIPLLDSYQISQAYRMAPGFSGLLVGSFFFGSAIGSLLSFLLLRFVPNTVMQPKAAAVAALSLHMIGYAVYLYGLLSSSIKQAHPYLAMVLILGRVVSGSGHGMLAQIVNTSTQRWNVGDEVNQQASRVFFTNSLGVGGGPLLAAASHVISGVPSWSASAFHIVPLCQLILALGAMVAMLGLFPDLSSMSAASVDQRLAAPAAAAAVSAAATQQDVGRHKKAIYSCIAVYAIRCFVCGGLETGSSLLMERDGHMTHTQTGLLCSVSFLTIIPLKLAQTRLMKDQLSNDLQFRMFALSAIFGCFLLFQGVCAWFGSVALVVSASIVFPFMYLCDSMTFGFAIRQAAPSGEFLDANQVSILCLLFGSGVGRVFGPWFARWQLESFLDDGQNSYALCQLFFCGLILLLFERGINSSAFNNEPQEKKSVSWAQFVWGKKI